MHCFEKVTLEIEECGDTSIVSQILAMLAIIFGGATVYTIAA